MECGVLFFTDTNGLDESDAYLYVRLKSPEGHPLTFAFPQGDITNSFVEQIMMSIEGGCWTLNVMYARLQTVWSLHGHSRQANKDHSPLCHRRPNGDKVQRLADKVVQPTTPSAEGCTSDVGREIGA